MPEKSKTVIADQPRAGAASRVAPCSAGTARNDKSCFIATPASGSRAVFPAAPAGAAPAEAGAERSRAAEGSGEGERAAAVLAAAP